MLTFRQATPSNNPKHAYWDRVRHLRYERRPTLLLIESSSANRALSVRSRLLLSEHIIVMKSAIMAPIAFGHIRALLRHERTDAVAASYHQRQPYSSLGSQDCVESYKADQANDMRPSNRSPDNYDGLAASSCSDAKPARV